MKFKVGDIIKHVKDKWVVKIFNIDKHNAMYLVRVIEAPDHFLFEAGKPYKLKFVDARRWELQSVKKVNKYKFGSDEIPCEDCGYPSIGLATTRYCPFCAGDKKRLDLEAARNFGISVSEYWRRQRLNQLPEEVTDPDYIDFDDVDFNVEQKQLLRRKQ